MRGWFGALDWVVRNAARTLVGQAVIWSVGLGALSVGVGVFEFDGWLSHPLVSALAFAVTALFTAIGIAAGARWYRAKATLSPFIGGREAIRWIAYQSDWGWRKFSRVNFWDTVLVLAPSEFNGKIRDHEIAAVGRPGLGAQYRDISPIEWRTIQLKADDILNPNRRETGTELRGFYATAPVLYDDVLIKREDLENLWPEASFHLRAWAWFIVTWRKRVRPRIAWWENVAR